MTPLILCLCGSILISAWIVASAIKGATSASRQEAIELGRMMALQQVAITQSLQPYDEAYAARCRQLAAASRMSGQEGPNAPAR